MSQAVTVFWFRRDLRIDDNAGLYYALRTGYPVVPVFIYDSQILEDLEDKNDKRLSFIRDALYAVQQQLEKQGSTLHILQGTPRDCFKKILEDYTVVHVFTNEDYEPYALQRDREIAEMLLQQGIGFQAFKDQVIFAKNEILKDDGTPYTVYTPYSKKWKQSLDDFFLKPYPTGKYCDRFFKQPAKRFPGLQSIGFEEAPYVAVAPELNEEIAKDYHKTRNTPAQKGTTELSVHLRFGTVSIRKIAARARLLNETLLGELIWRDFFSGILYHFPHTVSASFKPAYDNIRWRYAEKEFERWCAGKTGYPIVDAGMRQLNETGWMHNRVRMVTASFLCKHLLIDWRWGEAYFAKKLLDYDMSQNIGNWQWVAGSGVDAAPYFRIFNPVTQQEKFDPDLEYVKNWVPEYGTATYPKPMVDHAEARERCLQAYKAAVST